MSFGFPRDADTFPILSRADMNTIHNATLDILERTGIKIPSEKCLKILEDAGCSVDHKEKAARIPSYIVRESLKKGRSIVRLGARNPKYNIALDGRHVHVAAFGTGTHTIDLDTEEKRPSTSDDIVRAVKIVNSLDSYHLLFPTVTCNDAPVHIRNLKDVETALVNSEKHVTIANEDVPEVARYITRIAEAICGGVDELKRNPIISSIFCPISPLVLDGISSESAIEYAKASIPVGFATCCMPGATGPVTLAGSLAVCNAEVLASLVLIQSSFAGAPFIYGGSVAPFDMRIARRAGGAVEHGLMSASMGQLGRYYGLPSLGGAGYNTANEAGDQSCLEKVFCGLLPFANADIIEGFGCIEDGKTLSFAQLVIDAEIVQMFHRLTRKIEVNDTTLALDLIHKVKPGGTYLTERHTNDYLRNEHYIPSLIRRQFYETWVKDGSKSIADLAREKAKKIVETTSIKPLEKDIQDEIATVVKEADKKLSKSR